MEREHETCSNPIDFVIVTGAFQRFDLKFHPTSLSKKCLFFKLAKRPELVGNNCVTEPFTHYERKHSEAQFGFSTLPLLRKSGQMGHRGVPIRSGVRACLQDGAASHAEDRLPCASSAQTVVPTTRWAGQVWHSEPA